MEQRKAYSVKLETGIATPELAIRKHHPLENDLRAQDSTAVSRPNTVQDSPGAPSRTRQRNYIRKARHHVHANDMCCVKLSRKFPCTSETMLLGEVLPIWQPMPRPPTASDTLPPQNHHHPTTSHHVTNIQ